MKINFIKTDVIKIDAIKTDVIKFDVVKIDVIKIDVIKLNFIGYKAQNCKGLSLTLQLVSKCACNILSCSFCCV